MSITLSYLNQSRKWNLETDIQHVVDDFNNNENEVKTLHLTGNTLGVKAAEALTEPLSKQSSLTKLSLNDLFTGRGKDEIGSALKALSSGLIRADVHLVELDLSDNAFGPNGVMGIINLISNPCCYTLKVLNMNNEGLGHQGCQALVNAMKTARENSGKQGLNLEVFIAGRNRLENEGMAMLSGVFGDGMCSLRKLVLLQNGIGLHGIDGLKNLIVSIKNHKGLQILDISDNTIKDDGMHLLANVLPEFEHLEELYLDDCLLRKKGAGILCSILDDRAVCPNLKIISLNGNEIKSSEALNLVNAIVESKPNLEKLDLRNNELRKDSVCEIMDILNGYGKGDIFVEHGEDSGDEDRSDDGGSKDSSDSEDTDDDDDGDDDDSVSKEDDDDSVCKEDDDSRISTMKPTDLYPSILSNAVHDSIPSSNPNIGCTNFMNISFGGLFQMNISAPNDPKATECLTSAFAFGTTTTTTNAKPNPFALRTTEISNVPNLFGPKSNALFSANTVPPNPFALTWGSLFSNAVTSTESSVAPALFGNSQTVFSNKDSFLSTTTFAPYTGTLSTASPSLNFPASTVSGLFPGFTRPISTATSTHPSVPTFPSSSHVPTSSPFTVSASSTSSNNVSSSPFTLFPAPETANTNSGFISSINTAVSTPASLHPSSSTFPSAAHVSTTLPSTKSMSLTSSFPVPETTNISFFKPQNCGNKCSIPVTKVSVPETAQISFTKPPTCGGNVFPARGSTFPNQSQPPATSAPLVAPTRLVPHSSSASGRAPTRLDAASRAAPVATGLFSNVRLVSDKPPTATVIGTESSDSARTNIFASHLGQSPNIFSTNSASIKPDTAPFSFRKAAAASRPDSVIDPLRAAIIRCLTSDSLMAIERGGLRVSHGSAVGTELDGTLARVAEERPDNGVRVALMLCEATDTVDWGVAILSHLLRSPSTWSPSTNALLVEMSCIKSEERRFVPLSKHNPELPLSVLEKVMALGPLPANVRATMCVVLRNFSDRTTFESGGLLRALEGGVAASVV